MEFQLQFSVRIDSQSLPQDLAEIVAVWPELPEHIKAAIKALIKTAIEAKCNDKTDLAVIRL